MGTFLYSFIGFFKIDLDSAGHEVGEWDEKSVYKKYHTTEKLKETYQSKENTLTALMESPDGELEVRAVMGPDCQSLVTVEVLGKHAAQMEM